MMTADDFANGLIRASPQAAVLVLVVLLVQRLFKGQLSARWRCALWAIPALRLLLPVTVSSGLSMFNLVPKWEPQQTAPAVVPTSPSLPRTDIRHHFSRNTIAEFHIDSPLPDNLTAPEPVHDPGEGISDHRKPLNIDDRLQNKAPPVPPAPRNSAPLQNANHRVRLAPAFLALWLGGAVFFLSRVLVNCRRFQLAFRDAREITCTRTVDLLNGCAEELHVSVPVRLVESALVTSPVLHGLRKPRLVLPVGLTESLSWKELRFIFLHELAHVRRRDILQNWIGTLLQTVHWFNPLVWLAFARWREDRELACDAVALETAGEEEKQEYGRTILRMLQASPSVCGTPAMVGIMENKDQLKQRISMIASFRRSKRWSMLAMTLMLLVGLAGLTDARRMVHAATKTISEGTPPLLTATLPPPPQITNGPAVKITVLNEAGEPLKGAEVKAPHQAAFLMGGGNAPTWGTDDKGVAVIRLGEVPDDKMRMMQWFTVSVIHKDYAPLGMSWSVQQGDARKNVPPELKAVLKKGIALGGKIQDENGKPLPNVRVGLSGTGYAYENQQMREQVYGEYSSDPRGSPTAITDENGKWVAQNVPADLERVQLIGHAPGRCALFLFNSHSELPAGNGSPQRRPGKTA